MIADMKIFLHPRRYFRFVLAVTGVFVSLAALAGDEGKQPLPGDLRFDAYLPLLEGKRVALFSNQTGMVGEEHILDVLIGRGVNVTAIFSPEHGFRGTADAGAAVTDGTDARTGVPILSLYGPRGEHRPAAESMAAFDILVADIQDVGLRFYTYYITLANLLDACGACGKQVVLLDRPNPNGHYVDGPLLDMRLKSGVGAFPMPVVHGLTLGELMRMAQGEGWLNEGNRCELTVIPCLDYTHGTPYVLPVPPSPNLPDMQAVYLYPSLCPFEGTPVSLGRGTDKPFQQYGHPAMAARYTYCFIPESRPGAANPPLMGKRCYGVDLSDLSEDELWNMGLDLRFVVDAYSTLKEAGAADGFFRRFFDLLMGQTYVREMIEAGASADEIKERWADDVAAFKQQRKPYLLYPEEQAR